MKPIFLLFISLSLFGIEKRCCSITDFTKHESNQRLLKNILDQELSSLNVATSTAEQANYLTHQIFQIAKKLIEEGFYSDAYSVPAIDGNSTASYNSFVLWEGGDQAPVPLPITFFAYVWPSEHYIFQNNPSAPLHLPYGTQIHSHPMTCAFAVLEGTLVQKTFELIAVDPLKTIRLKSEEPFRQFDGSVDTLDQPFIHQIVNKGTSSTLAISLHAYGFPTAKQVRKCIQDNSEIHFYHHIWKKEGVIETLASNIDP